MLSLFKNKLYILVGNETDCGNDGIMIARLVDWTKITLSEQPVALYKEHNKDEKPFYFGGMVLPYDERILNFLKPIPCKERFALVGDMVNLRRNIDHALERAKKESPNKV